MNTLNRLCFVFVLLVTSWQVAIVAVAEDVSWEDLNQATEFGATALSSIESWTRNGGQHVLNKLNEFANNAAERLLGGSCHDSHGGIGIETPFPHTLIGKALKDARENLGIKMGLRHHNGPMGMPYAFAGVRGCDYGDQMMHCKGICEALGTAESKAISQKLNNKPIDFVVYHDLYQYDEKKCKTHVTNERSCVAKGLCGCGYVFHELALSPLEAASEDFTNSSAGRCEATVSLQEAEHAVYSHRLNVAAANVPFTEFQSFLASRPGCIYSAKDKVAGCSQDIHARPIKVEFACATMDPMTDPLPLGAYVFGNPTNHPADKWLNLYRVNKDVTAVWDYHTLIPEVGCRGGFGTHIQGVYSAGCIAVPADCFSKIRNLVTSRPQFMPLRRECNKCYFGSCQFGEKAMTPISLYEIIVYSV